MSDTRQNNKIRVLDYFFIMRPTLFFPLWTFFLAGCYGAQRTNIAINDLRVILSMLLLTMLMGSVYIINQIVDVETDAKNDKLFFIAKGIIDKKTAQFQAAVLLIFSVSAAFILDIKLGAIFLIVAFFTGLLYSVKPFSWKDRPILGVLTNFGGGWSIVVCGWISAGYWGMKSAIGALPYAIAIVAVFLLTTIPDIRGDREVGKITFGVKFGVKNTTFWALIFEIGCAISSFLLNEWILFFPAVIAMPLFVFAAIKRDEISIARAIKFTVLLASLAVCLVYPFYLILLMVNYFFSKWYYRARFNLEYPRFAA